MQSKSECIKKKMEMMKKAMEEEKEIKPKGEDVPGLYCSGGKATCKDLNMEQMCICGSCPIWVQYKLMNGKPSMYFCRDGKAR